MQKMQRSLLVIFSCLIAFTFCELILRVPIIADRVVPYAHRVRNEWHREDYDHNTFHIWREKSFRSFHLGEPKRSHELRILVLGDSFTWRDKIRDTSQIWPYILEQEISMQSISNQVINLAHRGDTTVNELEYLQKFGWELDPDIVIVQYLLNDPLPSAPGFRRESSKWMRADVIPLALSYQLHDMLNKQSYFYSLINAGWEGALRRVFRLKNMNYFSLHEEGFGPWEDTKMAIRQIAAECRQRDIPLLFVMMPLFPRGGDLADYPFTRLHHKLRTLVEGKGVPYLDLLPVYANVNPVPEYWHALPTDAHPNADAHRLAGHTIAAKLMQMGILSLASKVPSDRRNESQSEQDESGVRSAPHH